MPRRHQKRRRHTVQTQNESSQRAEVEDELDIHEIMEDTNDYDEVAAEAIESERTSEGTKTQYIRKIKAVKNWMRSKHPNTLSYYFEDSSESERSFPLKASVLMCLANTVV